MARLPRYRTGDPEIDEEIAGLIEKVGDVNDADLVFELIVSAVRLARDRATRDVLRAVEAWTRAALALTKHGGTVTAIIRADREGDIREAAHAYGGVVFPLFPRLGQEPKRVIVRIVKSPGVGFASAVGLVLHEADGRNTDAAEAVLRHGRALNVG